MLSALHKHQNHDLNEDNTCKHTQRINRGIGNRRTVARQRRVGIVECHRVGHRAAEHSASASERAIEGTVILENDSFYVLKKDGQKVDFFAKIWLVCEKIATFVG